MAKIYGGKGLSTAISELSINATKIFEDSWTEVWELSDEELMKFDEVPAGQWKDEWGWWRYCYESPTKSSVKKIQITFEEFKKHIEAIEKTECLQIDINRVTREYAKYGPGEVTLHLPSLADNVIDLLEILTQDEDEWISCYIYELDFGQKYYEGCVKDKNGNAVSLATIEDLWNILTRDFLVEGVD